jgi:acetyl-CoA C-acetyltransferase
MENIATVSDVRIPISRYGGSLKDITVSKLASIVLNEAVKRAHVEPAWVDDVIKGQSYKNGECANGARVPLLEAGWPPFYHYRGIL